MGLNRISNRDVAANGDLGFYIGSGQVPGVTNQGVDGAGEKVSSVPSDLWVGRELAAFGGTDELTYPTAGEQWTVESTSPNDTVGGTGTHFISITFMEESTRVYTSEFIALNGTTPVDLTSSDAYRPASAVSILTGSLLENDGAILVKRKSDSLFRGGIAVGAGSTEAGRFTVPSGFTWGIIGRFHDVPKDSDTKIRIRASVGLGIGGGWFDFANFDAYQGNGVITQPEFMLAIPQGAEFRFTATSTNPNSNVRFTFFGRLIDNTCITTTQVNAIQQSFYNRTPMHLYL